jgi:hypothetical protein
MAAFAELTWRIDGNRAAFRIPLDMALNALFQAVPRSTDPFVHGRIPLVEQKPHVVAPNDWGLFHTLFPLALRHYR